MIVDIEHNEKLYRINTTPDRGLFAEVTALHKRELTGPVAYVLQTYGKEAVTYDEIVIEDDELIDVISSLDPRLSTSKAWRRLYDWAWMRKVRQARREH